MNDDSVPCAISATEYCFTHRQWKCEGFVRVPVDRRTVELAAGRKFFAAWVAWHDLSRNTGERTNMALRRLRLTFQAAADEYADAMGEERILV